MSAVPDDELTAAVMQVLRDEPVDVHDPDNWKWVDDLEWPKPVAVAAPEPVLAGNPNSPYTSDDFRDEGTRDAVDRGLGTAYEQLPTIGSEKRGFAFEKWWWWRWGALMALFAIFKFIMWKFW